MPSVIVAATPVSGHTLPLLEIARSLTARGDTVTIVGGKRFEQAALATGAKFAPLQGVADYDDRDLDESFPGRADHSPGMAQLAFDIGHIFGDVIPEQHNAIQRLLEADGDQVLIADCLFLGMWPVLLGARGIRPLRTVAIGITTMMLGSNDTSAFGPVPPLPGGDPSSGNQAANAGMNAALSEGQAHLESVLHGLGATTEIPPFWDATVTVPDVYAQLTVQQFEFERSDAPANLRFVGPLPIRHRAAYTHPSWWAELNETRPVVVVTQGTIANTDFGALIGPTLEALADLDVLVVAALGRDVSEFTEPIPPNAHIEAFIPFDQLLPKASVLVTNGGYGGTQQALAAGVPVIVAGDTEDKPFVAARVQHFGVGVDLHTGRPSVDQIRAAVETVLQDPSYQTAASELSQHFLDGDALETIKGLIDQA